MKRKQTEATNNGKSRVVYPGLAGTATATTVTTITLLLTVVTTIIVVRELAFTAPAVTVVAEVEADTFAAATTTGAPVLLWV